jgi:nucleotide-binding universal stress UspA family protein
MLHGSRLDRFDAGGSPCSTQSFGLRTARRTLSERSPSRKRSHARAARRWSRCMSCRGFASQRGLAVHADEEIVEARLKKVVDGLSAEGFDATLKIVNHIGPQAAHEIADVADEVGADLIVVGTRGYGPIAGLVLGSVTLRLLHVAACPVLAVPAVAQPADERGVDAAHVGN